MLSRDASWQGHCQAVSLLLDAAHGAVHGHQLPVDALHQARVGPGAHASRQGQEEGQSRPPPWRIWPKTASHRVTARQSCMQLLASSPYSAYSAIWKANDDHIIVSIAGAHQFTKPDRHMSYSCILSFARVVKATIACAQKIQRQLGQPGFSAACASTSRDFIGCTGDHP